MLPTPDAIVEALRDAAGHRLAGDDGRTDAAMVAIAHQPPQTEPRPKLGVRVQAGVFMRDGCTCRYCGRRAIPSVVLRLFSALWPAHLPYHPHGKMTEAHVAYWTVMASIDHLHAGTMGGDWRAPENLVTACWPCQQAKGNTPIELLRWELRDPDPGWDGLISVYPRLWEAGNEPDPDVHLPWIRAFTDTGSD